MNHASIYTVITSAGTEYQIMREDGVILASTFIEHYAEVILKAIEADIEKNDNADA